MCMHCYACVCVYRCTKRAVGANKASAFVDPRITPDTLTFNCAVISILPLH